MPVQEVILARFPAEEDLLAVAPVGEVNQAARYVLDLDSRADDLPDDLLKLPHTRLEAGLFGRVAVGAYGRPHLGVVALQLAQLFVERPDPREAFAQLGKPATRLFHRKVFFI